MKRIHSDEICQEHKDLHSQLDSKLCKLLKSDIKNTNVEENPIFKKIVESNDEILMQPAVFNKTISELPCDGKIGNITCVCVKINSD